jgi:hypothetical protein
VPNLARPLQCFGAVVADVLEDKKSAFELLEHVLKGVHVEGRGPKNHRIVPRQLDRADDAPDKRQRPKPKRSR